MLIAVLVVSSVSAQVLELTPGVRICLVGNTLGERMQHHYIEFTLDEILRQLEQVN